MVDAADRDCQVVCISALAGLVDSQRLKLRMISRNGLKCDRRDTLNARGEGDGLKPRLLHKRGQAEGLGAECRQKRRVQGHVPAIQL